MKPSYIIGSITIASAITLSVFFMQSKKLNEDILSIKPPIEGHDISFDQYLFHSDSNISIERNTGTHLNIPAKSFTRKDGSKPTGEIALKVREMHDPYAIMRSGIPMEIAGSDGNHLQSAGMIEIRAFEGNEELKIGEGKKIGIELAAYKESDEYSLYYLDDDQRWETRDRFSYRQNERKKNNLNKLSKIPPPPVDSIKENEFIFVISGDTNTNPELKPFLDQEWLLLENEKMETAKKAVRQNWSKVKITPVKKRKMEYEITFSLDEQIFKDYGIPATYSFLAKPIMSKDQGRRKNRKEFEQKMEEYALLLKQNEEEKERVKMQADMVNAFSINQTGVWNIDKIMKEEVIITKVHFDFEGEMKGVKTEHKIFMIFEDNNSVIYVSRSEWDKIPFPVSKRVSIAAVINDSKVAFIPSEDISRKVNRGDREIRLTSKRMSYYDFINRLN